MLVLSLYCAASIFDLRNTPFYWDKLTVIFQFHSLYCYDYYKYCEDHIPIDMIPIIAPNKISIESDIYIASFGYLKSSCCHC